MTTTTNTDSITPDLTNFDRRDPRARPVAPNAEARELMSDMHREVQKVIDAQQSLLSAWKDVAEALSKHDWAAACLAVLNCDTAKDKMLQEGTALVWQLAKMKTAQSVLHDHAVYGVHEEQLKSWATQLDADAVRAEIVEHEQECNDPECDKGTMLREVLAAKEAS